MEKQNEYVEFIIQSLDHLFSLDRSSVSLFALKKKFFLQGADSYMKVGNYEMAKEMIENCCSSVNSQSEEIELISKGDKDEILVYFLAFKLHCFNNEQDEALEMFQ